MMLHTIAWWAWAIAAAVIGLAELHAPGSYLIWIALGPGLTAVVVALWDFSIAAQLGIFAAASAVSCIVGSFVYRRMTVPRRADTLLNQRNLQLVGARGVVCEAFAGGYGKVRLGDSVWLAQGPDLAEGTAVVVRSVAGTRVSVEVA